MGQGARTAGSRGWGSGGSWVWWPFHPVLSTLEWGGGCPYRHVRSIQESERWAREVRPEEPLGAVSAHSSPPSWLPAPPWDA